MLAMNKNENMLTEKPKRPMSAYMLWLGSARESIKADLPGSKVTDIAKKAGEIWRGMKDKSEWEEKAVQAKDQYTKDLQTYNANNCGGGDEAGQKAQKRGKKASKKPAAATKSKKKKEESDEEEEEESE